MRMSDLDDMDEDRLNYKIILLGLSMVGKTKLLARYKFGVFDPTGVTTVAVDSYCVKAPGVCFNYHDTAGQ